jgi:TQXA domain-containing protein/LPXTG-motif cell wall-anchored protein
MITAAARGRALRAMFPLAVAGALGALLVGPSAPALADTGKPQDSRPVSAAYVGGGTGYNKVLEGRAAGTTLLKVEGGDTVEGFCVQFGVDVAQDSSYKAKSYAASKVSNAGVAAYLALNHNKIGEPLADARAEAAATQLAIWKFTDNKDFKDVPNSSIVARANRLVSGAHTHTEAPASFNLTSTAVSGTGKDADAVVTVTVRTDEGKGVVNQPVTITIGDNTLRQTTTTTENAPDVVKESDAKTTQESAPKTYTVKTDAEGKAVLKVPAPQGKTQTASVRLSTVLPAGSILVPNGQAMVTTGDAKITRSTVLTIPAAAPAATPTPTPTPTPTEEPTPTEQPTPTETPGPVDIDEPAPTDVPRVPASDTKEPEPQVLPHTGGTTAVWMLLGALGLTGAGLVARKRLRQQG